MQVAKYTMMQKVLHIATALILLSILAAVYWDMWSDIHHLLRIVSVFTFMIAIQYAGICCYKNYCKDIAVVPQLYANTAVPVIGDKDSHANTKNVMMLFGSILYIICISDVWITYYAGFYGKHLIFFLWLAGLVPVAVYIRSVCICAILLILYVYILNLNNIFSYLLFLPVLIVTVWVSYYSRSIVLLLLLIFVTILHTNMDNYQHLHYGLYYLAFIVFVLAVLFIYMHIIDKNPDKWFSMHRMMALKHVDLCTILPQVMIVVIVLIYSLLPLAFGDRLNVSAMPVHINYKTGEIILDYAAIADKSCAGCFDIDSFEVRKEISNGKELYLGMSGCNASVCSTQQLVDMPPQADYYIRGSWFANDKWYPRGIVSFKHINKHTVPKDKLDSIREYYLRDDAKATVVSLKVLQESGRAYISELTFPDEMCAIVAC